MANGHDQDPDYDPANMGGELSPDIQDEVDAALGGMSLFDLVDSEEPPVSPAVEGVRRGTVVAIQKSDILVDMGGKSTGVLPLAQLGGEPTPQVGDSIEAMVTGYDEREGLLLLSRKDAVMAATWETMHVGMNVQGIVTGHNKGGLELKIDGIDAFMPISQIDVERIEAEDIPGYVNKRMQCKVSEFNRGEESLIVSRRAVMKEEAAKTREEMLNNLVEGQTVTGTVRTIMPYGAFVDIGGVDGLLHISDMGYARIEDPSKVVSEGQQLELKVLKVDREAKRIALGLKQTLADPWEDAETKWPVNTLVSGRVTRLMDFGAFVELTEGVEGLIPISEMTYERRIHHPREVINENDVVKVRVLSMDLERQRIALSIKRAQDDPWVGASARWPEGSVIEAKVTRLTGFGAFVELTAGVEGLVHISELAEGRVNNVAEVVREGDRIQAKVLEVDEDRRRISLSIKQVTTMPDYTGPDAPEPLVEKPKRKRKKPLKGGLDW